MQNIEELVFDVEFMNCEVDRADNFRVIACDSHFVDFTGINPKNENLFLYEIIEKEDRERALLELGKKNASYCYFDFGIKNRDGEFVLVHCSAQSDENGTISSITFADVSRSERKTEILNARTSILRNLIDEISVGICLFKVNKDMHFEAININKACCSFFGTERELLIDREFLIDDLIHPDDKSEVFQAIGKSMATKKPFSMTLRVITHKNKYIQCKFSAAINSFDEYGCPVFHATFTDISDLIN